MQIPPLPSTLPDEIAIRERATRFADDYLRPYAVEDDQKSFFRRKSFTQAASLGLTALAIPKECHGGGASHRLHYAALEEIAKSSASMAIVIGVTNLIQGALVQFGTAEQKKTFLPRLTSGEWLGAFSLSEPQAGSDAAALRLQAKRVSGGYQLTGNKVWCTSAGHADLYLVMARTDTHKTRGITSFLIPKNTPGFHVGKQEKKMGLCASSLAELVFENCFVPESAVLGKEGMGLKVALSQLDAGRIAIGVVGCGLTLEAIEKVRFSEKEAEQKATLAQYYALSLAIRSLVRLTADERDLNRRTVTMASAIKLLGSDLAMAATGFAIECFGTEGSKRDLGIERLWRDAKSLQIVEGTNQIQRLVLSRELEDLK